MRRKARNNSVLEGVIIALGGGGSGYGSGFTSGVFEESNCRCGDGDGGDGNAVTNGMTAGRGSREGTVSTMMTQGNSGSGDRNESGIGILHTLPPLDELIKFVDSPTSSHLSTPTHSGSGPTSNNPTHPYLNENRALGWTEGGGNILLKAPNCSALDPELEFEGGCLERCECEEGCGCRG